MLVLTCYTFFATEYFQRNIHEIFNISNVSWMETKYPKDLPFGVSEITT